MKKYITPETEIIEFDVEDVILTSGRRENIMRTTFNTSSITEEDDPTFYDDPFGGSEW